MGKNIFYEKKNVLSNDSSPLVTIGIPTYNGEKYIKEAIDSVISQTYTNLEIIISDDGSTDSTMNIVKSFNDPRIKILYNLKHDGKSNFMNCLNHATGKYFKLLCHDDLLTENSIEMQTTAFEENPDVSIVTGCSYVIDPAGRKVMSRCVYKSDKKINGKKFAKKTLLSARNYYGEPSVSMYRTEQAKEINIFDVPKNITFCVDWCAGLELSYLGNVFYISNPVAKFRLSDISLSVKINKSNERKIIYSSCRDLFLWHKERGIIKLNYFEYIIFNIILKINNLARYIIQQFKVTNKNEVLK